MKPPEEGRKPGSSEKSMDNFHLDHIMVFADAECSRVGWCKRGWVFFSPGPPFSPPLYPFSHQVPSPLVLTVSLSHISGAPSPVSQLSKHTIHSTLLYCTLATRYFRNIASLFRRHFLHSSLAPYFTKLGRRSWLWLVTDRLLRKTSGCEPTEIALMFWQLYLQQICHLVTTSILR